jgi:hypothetical protein
VGGVGKVGVLSMITGGSKWVEITAHADPLYQHLIVTAERKFWRCIESGEQPQLFDVEPPKPRIEAIRVVDMSASNAWAEFAAAPPLTRPQSHHRPCPFIGGMNRLGLAGIGWGRHPNCIVTTLD